MLDVGDLEYSRSYHWRIDMVNGDEILKGTVWTFTTPYLGPGIVMGDFEQVFDGWVMYPDEAGELGFSQTGVTLGDYSLALSHPGSGYWKIRYAGSPVDLTRFDTLKFDATMLVSDFEANQWTQFEKLSLNSSLGWREFTEEDDCTVYNRDTGELSKNDWGSWDGDQNKTFLYDITHDEGWEGILDSSYFQINMAIQSNAPGTFHIDNVRFLNSREASKPNPGDRETDVAQHPILSWDAGSTASSYHVYIGTEPNAVRDVNQSNIQDYPDVTFAETTETNHDPGPLEFKQVYHWRVDAVEAGGTLWAGPVWQFATGDYIVLEDFEDYNDFILGFEIYEVWFDGWLPDDQVNPDNGSVIMTEVLSDGTQAM
ncbi:MAG: hypothetical protein MI922_19100, partial [Bacteroidales bacterium]|nr:hypothetical protein [Bacteroidales bacterium]